MLLRHGLAGLAKAPAGGGGSNLFAFDDFQASDWNEESLTGFSISGGVFTLDGTQSAFSTMLLGVGSRAVVSELTTYELSVTVSALPVDGRVRIFMDEFDGGVDQGAATLVIDLNTIGSTGTYTGQITTQAGTDSINVQIESTVATVECSFNAISLVAV